MSDELQFHLARHAEQVCRHYLSNGRREGSYWLVGDVANTPGRSLFVRLRGPISGKGAAGIMTHTSPSRGRGSGRRTSRSDCTARSNKRAALQSVI